MKSKLEVLKRYQSKKSKKKTKKQIPENDAQKPADSNSMPDFNYDFNEEEEKPVIYAEDGVTLIPLEKVKTVVTSDKWKPFDAPPQETEENPENAGDGNQRKRHDSDSEYEGEIAQETYGPTIHSAHASNSYNTPSIHENIYKNISEIYENDKTGIKTKSNETPLNSHKYNEDDIKRDKNGLPIWGVSSSVHKDQSKESRISDIVKEMGKPLARYRDDPDLDRHLKSMIREEDPLKHMVYVEKSEVKEEKKRIFMCYRNS